MRDRYANVVIVPTSEVQKDVVTIGAKNKGNDERNRTSR